MVFIKPYNTYDFTLPIQQSFFTINFRRNALAPKRSVYFTKVCTL